MYLYTLLFGIVTYNPKPKAIDLRGNLPRNEYQNEYHTISIVTITTITSLELNVVFISFIADLQFVHPCHCLCDITLSSNVCNKSA